MPTVVRNLLETHRNKGNKEGREEGRKQRAENVAGDRLVFAVNAPRRLIKAGCDTEKAIERRHNHFDETVTVTVTVTVLIPCSVPCVFMPFTE